MPQTVTYVQMLADTKALAALIRASADRHQQLASHLDEEAKDTGRIAEQISTLHVDPATIAETQELARIMQGVSQAAVEFATAAGEVARAARAAEQQTATDHHGIHEAARSAPVPMAARTWYSQE